jgi:hypothetical protein
MNTSEGVAGASGALALPHGNARKAPFHAFSADTPEILRAPFSQSAMTILEEMDKSYSLDLRATAAKEIAYSVVATADGLRVALTGHTLPSDFSAEMAGLEREAGFGQQAVKTLLAAWICRLRVEQAEGHMKSKKLLLAVLAYQEYAAPGAAQRPGSGDGDGGSPGVPRFLTARVLCTMHVHSQTQTSSNGVCIV